MVIVTGGMGCGWTLLKKITLRTPAVTRVLIYLFTSLSINTLVIFIFIFVVFFMCVDTSLKFPGEVDQDQTVVKSGCYKEWLTCTAANSSTSYTSTTQHLCDCWIGRANLQLHTLIACTIALLGILKMTLSSLLHTLLFGENSVQLQYVLENTTQSTYNFPKSFFFFSFFYAMLIFMNHVK